MSEAAQRNYGASSLDIDTAFLNAFLSQATEELIYVKPPALLILFQLVATHVYWIARRAIYGLRQSPRQWGIHRDTEVKKMRFKVGKKILKAIQSSIDVALWILVEDDNCISTKSQTACAYADFFRCFSYHGATPRTEYDRGGDIANLEN